MDDFSLIRRCIEGDTDAYRHIVERYKDRVAHLIYPMIKQKSDVEDLTQEVFIKAYRSLDKFKFDASFYTWLYRIAVNHTLDYLRKRKLTSIISLEVMDDWLFGRMRGTTYTIDAASEDIRRAEDKELVEWAMDRISTESRTIIILREFEGMSYEEIAGVLEISLPAVKSRLFRARSDLKKVLTPALRGEK